MFLTGKVTSADANTGQVSWGGYQVVITQSLHVDDVTQSVDQSFGVWEDGGYVVEVQDKVAPDTMIGVVAPTGQLLVRRGLSSLTEGSSTTLNPLPVKRPDLNLTVAPPAPAQNLSTRVSGRVFVASDGSPDHSAAAALEVRVFGSNLQGAHRATHSTLINAPLSVRQLDKMGTVATFRTTQTPKRRIPLLAPSGGVRRWPWKGSHQRHSGLPASLARSCFVQDVGYLCPDNALVPRSVMNAAGFALACSARYC